MQKRNAERELMLSMLADSLSDAKQSVKDESLRGGLVDRQADRKLLGVSKRGENVAKASAGKKVLDLAIRNAPGAVDLAREYFGKQGKNLDDLATSNNIAVQGAVVKSLLKGGLNAATLAEEAQLTQDEERQYTAIIRAARTEQSKRVDAGQVKPVGTGNAYIDGVARTQEILDICEIMGISTDTYARIIRGVHTHTTKDIEEAQLDQRIRRKKVA